MKTNRYGYVIPLVDESKCVHCGICDRICPFLNHDNIPKITPKLYSAYTVNERIRALGSSGSMFYQLASYVFSCNGIVFGAAFDGLKLIHTSATSFDNLQPLMKSKYIQSDTTGIYNEVINIIKSKKLVLFVGTPCQCRALYNAIGQKHPDNLLIVDFICHGVPGQELFDKCIKSFEKKNDCIVHSFSFREKTKESLRSFAISYDKNGRTYTKLGHYSEFPFYNGYLNYYIFRDSCYDCKYLGVQRISDFTLGDFWFLDSIRNITDFNKGYSMFIVNSQKGKDLFDFLNKSGEFEYEEFPISTAVELNHAYTKPTHKSIVNRFLMRDYASGTPIEKIEQRYFSAHLSFFKKCIRYVLVKTGL